MHTSCDFFWELWQRHSEHLLRQSLRMMKGNQAEAEDAFGATRLRAYEGSTTSVEGREAASAPQGTSIPGLQAPRGLKPSPVAQRHPEAHRP